MVKRRRLMLTIASMGATSTIAGCAGLLDELDNDESESNNNQRPDPNTPRNNDDSSNNAETTEQSTPETSPLKGEIVSTYDDGIGTHNSAMDDMNSAVSTFNDGNYARSESLGNSAASGFDDAKSKFSEAYSKAMETENQRAQTICSDAEKYVTRMKSAAEAQVRAAKAAQDGDQQRANDHIEIFRSRSQRAEEVSVVTAETLEKTF